VRKSRLQAEVEIQVTPMLDMAFQLLTFFIMTFRPTPTEGQFAMSLLPAQPATRMDAPISTDPTTASEVPAGLRTLPTTLHATNDGELARVTLGEVEIGSMDELKKQLKEILNDPTLPFDQALIKVDPRLKYEPLIQVVDVFSQLNVTKISFDELTSEPEGGLP
jgi:biopolymer transport protein ExbD